ncbi:MAG TPA: SRPBCC domain-containing protein [Usitatibacter sp.]|nr:SRPBCC domain-containing protein [Usitatibacter sp.]
MAATRKPAARAAPRTRPGTRSARGPLGRAASGRNELRLAGVGTEAVMRATGRPWSEWLAVLDRAGARAMAHKDIAGLLSRRFGVRDWWSQMVTVGYEQARGLRAAHERADGYAATASRTVDAPVARLFDAWSDAQARSRWLLEAPVEVRRSVDGKSLRMTWQSGGSAIDVRFQPRGPGKSQVAVEHARLPTAASARTQKAFWSAALDRLKALLESTR